MTATSSACFKKDEGSEGEEQQWQGNGQESIVSSWPSESLATALKLSPTDLRFAQAILT